MSSETEIANLAISHLGIGKTIGSLEVEKSQEALSCKTYLDVARDATLKDFNWPFAGTFVSLALVAPNPTSEWKYSYRLPFDLLKPRRILSGMRNDSHQSRIPFKILSDGAGPLLYSDVQNAQLEYTKQMTDPTFYPADFVLALSYRLASLIAARITAGDSLNIGPKMLQLYKMQIEAAALNAFNGEQPDLEPESEFIRVRDGYDTYDPRNYFNKD